MNDSILSSDTSFFQDLSSNIHISEGEYSNSYNYFSNLSSTLQPLQLHPTLHFQFSPPRENQSNQSNNAKQNTKIYNSSNIIRDNNHNGKSTNDKDNSNSLRSLPFVQIHTTDVNPNRSNYGNVFRRNTANNDEIKSEPIKSESTEPNGKDNTSTNPTPPTQTGGPSDCGSVANEGIPSAENSICSHSQSGSLPNNGRPIENASEINKTSNDVKSASENISVPQIYKCSHCAFISLSESGVQGHVEKNHLTNGTYTEEMRLRVKCPGCDNFFFARNSFYVHLCEDHCMNLDEANKLLQAVLKTVEYVEPNLQSKNQQQVDTRSNEMQPKIFLKNVECLREPSSSARPLEDQLIQISDGNYFQLNDFDDGCTELLTDVTTVETEYIGIPGVTSNDLNFVGSVSVQKSPQKQQQQSPPKQKISIKSVDVLREPALLRRDLEMQNLSSVNGNQCDDHDFYDTMDTNNQFINYENNLDLDDSNAMPKDMSTFEKPRRPKIYIKNVDILKEPIVLSTNLNPLSGGGLDFNFISSNANFLSLSDSQVVTTQSQIFNGSGNGGSHICIGGIADSSILYDASTSNTFLQSINEIETFALGQNNNSDHFLLQSSKYQTNLHNLSTDTITQPIVTEPTPPPLSLEQQIDQSSLYKTQPSPKATTDAPITQQQQQQQQHQLQETQQQQKQKIFIKNVDILKEPQFQEPRGTLHLRTVDELNLMNKTEVENLIAPNLETSQHSQTNRDYVEKSIVLSTDNNEISGEAIPFNSLDLKLNESEDTQAMLNWNNSSYSLGAELDSIITEHTQAIAKGTGEAEIILQKQLYDLETPHMSVVSILNVEDQITDYEETETIPTNNSIDEDNRGNATNEVEVQQRSALLTNNSSEMLIHFSDKHHNCDAQTSSTNISSQQNIEEIINSPSQREIASPNSDELKRENEANINQTSDLGSVLSQKPQIIYAVKTSIALGSSTVTTSSVTSSYPKEPSTVSVSTNLSASESNSPTSPISKTSKQSTSAIEKGRIYVADNLMETNLEKQQLTALEKSSSSSSSSSADDAKEQPPVAVSITGGTSNRGRPFGSNRTGITKIRKLYGNAAAIDVGMKCNIQGCAFRFKKTETLDYHKRCHSGNSVSPHSMICPECQSTNFSNWNTLHTHLWRTHQIDMELYSCELCRFKTPIYSRLVNTHSKIHSEERNYKCDQCEKAFKNSKQLKNHRRWHRTTGGTTALTTKTTLSDDPVDKLNSHPLHRCKDCGSIFSHQKTLREHLCKDKVISCDICERVVSSKSSLKLHMRTHEVASRFKCTICDYRANDHNAFRRHKMTHDKNKMYLCPYCEYKSIQSVAYQKHIQQKHPQLADNVVLKCSECNFSTINRSLFTVHMAKHKCTEQCDPLLAVVTTEKQSIDSIGTSNLIVPLEGNKHNNENGTNLQQQQQPEQHHPQQQHNQQKNKIKVKSDLLLTDPSKFSTHTNSKSVTTLLMHCFDNAVT